MNDFELMIGFAVVVVATAGIILFSTKKFRTMFPPVFRRISGITRLRRAIGLSVEDGSRMHVTIGNANLNDPSNTSALVGLSSLHRLGQLSSTSDQPPFSTSGDGGTAILTKDVLKQVSVETHSRELYDPDYGHLTGVTPFSYAVGSLHVINDPTVKTNILIGNFGPEAAILSTSSEERDSYTLTASDSIVAQSVFMATTAEVLIGEELYAIPAYLAYNHIHLASLRVQDILRLLIGIVLLAGAILKLAGVV